MAQKWTLHMLDREPREQMIAGVERRFLSGDRATVAQIWLKPGALVPSHAHDSEQISYVVSGALHFTLGSDEVTVRAGQILVIPSNMPHSAKALEDTYDLDFFSPRRDDWITGDDAYLRGPRSAER